MSEKRNGFSRLILQRGFSVVSSCHSSQRRRLSWKIRQNRFFVKTWLQLEEEDFEFCRFLRYENRTILLFHPK